MARLPLGDGLRSHGRNLIGSLRQQPHVRRALSPLKPIYHRLRPPPPPGLNQRYDALTAQVIAAVVGPGDSCVDGGAHTGSILDLIIGQAPAGVHVAFEPLPALHAQLHARYADRIARGTLLLYDCALADEAGSTTFHHNVTSPAYSGIRRRRYDNDDTDIELITVEKMRLDDLVGPELRIAFLKLDIEGGEYHALLGARELLERDKPVVLFEFGPGAADHYGVTPPMMHTVFEDLAMDLYALDPDVDGPLDVDAFTQQYETANFYFCAIDRTRARPF